MRRKKRESTRTNPGVANDNAAVVSGSHGYRFYKRVRCDPDVPIVKDGATPTSVIEAAVQQLDRRLNDVYNVHPAVQKIVSDAVFAYINAFAQSDIIKTVRRASEHREEGEPVPFSYAPFEGIKRVSYVTYQLEEKLEAFKKYHNLPDEGEQSLNAHRIIGAVIRACIDQYKQIMGVEFPVSHRYREHAEKVLATFSNEHAVNR